jgi:hypothetical protein
MSWFSCLQLHLRAAEWECYGTEFFYRSADFESSWLLRRTLLTVDKVDAPATLDSDFSTLLSVDAILCLLELYRGRFAWFSGWARRLRRNHVLLK